MATPKRRIKSAAAAYVAQSKNEVISLIKQLGDKQRELVKAEAEMNNQIAAITYRYSPVAEKMKDEIKEMQACIQAWCNAHREELTDSNKVKTVNLTTGEVQWRSRPPSIRISKVAAVISYLKRTGLQRFIRNKEEINKDALLAEPDIVKSIPGVNILRGAEDFVITPFEQEIK